MFSMLFSNFLRPPGFDYRGKINNDYWRKFWDVALFVSSIIPMFFFGFIFGNLLMGLPFDFDPIFMRDFYTGDFWHLLNWCGIFAGLCSFFVLAMHGASYIALRSEDDLKNLFMKIQVVFGVLFLIFFTATGFIIAFHVKGYILDYSPIYATGHPLDNIVHKGLGAWLSSYHDHWWKIFGPLIAYLGTFICIISSISKFNFLSFCGSILAVTGTILTAGFALFPFIVPSITNPNESITVWNATSSYFALSVILIIVIILGVVICAYKIFAYRSIWRDKPTLNINDINKDPHTYY
jgi:cytochrome d ubiquinol oxidase subunit II